MTVFILSAVALVVLALVFIIPSLLKKDEAFSDEYDDLNISIAKSRLAELKQQQQAGEISEAVFEQMKVELESSLAQDLSNTSTTSAQVAFGNSGKIPAIILVFLVPLSALGIYAELGDFGAATGDKITELEIPKGEDRPEMTIEEAVVKLQQRLQEDPENAEGWFMLARTYMTMREYEKAVSAYQKTIDLSGEEPELLLRYVDALAMTEGGNLTGAARPILEKVIAQIPDSPTVLWMAGTMESQKGQFKQALIYWYRLKPMLNNEPEALQQIGAMITQAESKLSQEELAEVKQAVPVEQPVTQVSSIQVSVDLDPSLIQHAGDDSVVFVYAKAMQGPPMPLAAVKKRVADLPLTVELNDAMAMMPQMKLSSFKQVNVFAVVSQSGRPGIQAGDLFAEETGVETFSNQAIKLIINQQK